MPEFHQAVCPEHEWSDFQSFQQESFALMAYEMHQQNNGGCDAVEVRTFEADAVHYGPVEEPSLPWEADDDEQ